MVTNVVVTVCAVRWALDLAEGSLRKLQRYPITVLDTGNYIILYVNGVSESGTLQALTSG